MTRSTSLKLIEGADHDSAPTPPAPSKRLRAALVAGPVILTTMFGVNALFGSHGSGEAPSAKPLLKSNKPPIEFKYDTDRKVNELKTESFTFTEPGQGALDAIEAVDPGLSTSSEEMTQKVTEFLDKKDGDGIYQIGQTVPVPYVPRDTIRNYNDGTTRVSHTDEPVHVVHTPIQGEIKRAPPGTTYSSVQG